MNYNSKRLTNPLKPICRCKRQEFNTLVDIVCGSTSTKEHNKNFAFKKAAEELTSPCTDKGKDDDDLTLAELVMKIPYPIAGKYVSIDCDVFDATATVKPSGFFILVGDDNSVKCAESIYYYVNNNGRNFYVKNSYHSEDQRIKNIRFPLTDKDINVIKEVLDFKANALSYGEDTVFTTTLGSGTIYIYKLNDTD